MDVKERDKLLSLIRGPGRYLGSEVNTVKKQGSGVWLRAALAFPDLYDIGTSHFGIQILYSILNSQPGIAAERAYAPDQDMEKLLAGKNQELFSLESGKPLKSFDWIGFSLLYELNYTNVLTMLHLAGIPFFSKDRDGAYPLIIAGGPCTCNPEPVADFFDAILIGDGEDAVLEMAEAWKAWKESGSDKAGLLKKLAAIQGVYVPSLYPADKVSGMAAPLPGVAPRVLKAIAPDLNQAPFPLDPILPYSNPVHDRLRLEVARGCSRGCRFCQAGMIYRPVRERSAQSLCDLARDSLDATGYEDLSLLSLSVGDYSQVSWLMGRLMNELGPRKVSVSFPSMRAGTLTRDLMEQIKKVRKTGFTIAPEAGSQRLRDVINKNISEEEIVQTVSDAFFMGWKLIKLYFMIGLPTETMEDVQAIADLVLKLKALGGKRADVTASIGLFVPKPHTPFQWVRQITEEEARERLEVIRARIMRPGIKIKWQNPQVSALEGLFSRGDRKLSALLVDAWTKGARFDGWTDYFNMSLWRQAMADCSVDIEPYLETRGLDDPLPWDHIDMGVTKEFFQEEYSKALTGEKTPACSPDHCAGCGVCDFSKIRPVFSPPPGDKDAWVDESPLEGALCHKLLVRYSKTGNARFLGHLELASVFHRALRRARIPMLYSQGFHPMPKVAFSQALPVGMESTAEDFVITVDSRLHPQDLASALNAQLPEGLEVTGCLPFTKSLRDANPPVHHYEVLFDPRLTDKMLQFSESESFKVTHKNHKGKEWELDLASQVAIQSLEKGRVFMSVKNDPGKSIRPLEILGHILDLDPEALAGCRVTKHATGPQGS